MITTIADIKSAAHNAGSHFFEPEAMRFFRSRVLDYVYPVSEHCAYFVTSEQFDDTSPLLYSVRMIRDGQVSTVGDFQGYPTQYSAQQAAEALAKLGKVSP